MNPLTRRATLRHIELIERRKPSLMRRINPMLIAGAVIAASALWLVVGTLLAERVVIGGVSVGECRQATRSVQA